MMMYWCEDCGQAVEPVSVDHYDVHGEVDTRCYEHWNSLHCPICRAEVTTEADQCECGEYKPKDRDMCTGCEDFCKEVFDEAINSLIRQIGPNAEDLFLTYIENNRW